MGPDPSVVRQGCIIFGQILSKLSKIIMAVLEKTLNYIQSRLFAFVSVFVCPPKPNYFLRRLLTEM